ncbi:cleavage polyadenylation factor subunit fip1 [Puccinia graminis f. sp. tritici]|uniref:Cleavage polyadenylation factor subunit fip1 n=1 Tax=Puccinia graminis f. sp. tritici TaxID=56615 RepID=A0A5B0NZV1_PUCGR|nr:cleavage polyadenylation factor subunit fip1 [Puccinia graminis f. sp. tritici]KAA1094857.1 cleavage polyadenylation factor subunit fip1 [Puccinia graminis f. sp. tritici]
MQQQQHHQQQQQQQKQQQQQTQQQPIGLGPSTNMTKPPSLNSTPIITPVNPVQTIQTGTRPNLPGILTPISLSAAGPATHTATPGDSPSLVAMPSRASARGRGARPGGRGRGNAQAIPRLIRLSKQRWLLLYLQQPPRYPQYHPISKARLSVHPSNQYHRCHQTFLKDLDRDAAGGRGDEGLDYGGGVGDSPREDRKLISRRHSHKSKQDRSEKDSQRFERGEDPADRSRSKSRDKELVDEKEILHKSSKYCHRHRARSKSKDPVKHRSSREKGDKEKDETGHKPSKSANGGRRSWRSRRATEGDERDDARLPHEAGEERDKEKERNRDCNCYGKTNQTHITLKDIFKRLK